MPKFVREALVEYGPTEAYGNRPPYQQNDYIGWIIRAKREETRRKRLAQMLDELCRGDRYMNLAYRGKNGLALCSTGSVQSPIATICPTTAIQAEAHILPRSRRGCEPRPCSPSHFAKFLRQQTRLGDPAETRAVFQHTQFYSE